MRRVLGYFIASAAFALMLVGPATSASAHYRHHGGCCGPIPPSTYYKTIHPQRYVTRYRDRSVYRHRTRIHYVTHVTRVQPVVHINEVTRVHHHTIVHTRNAYRHVVQHLRPIVSVHHAVRNTYDCHCAR